MTLTRRKKRIKKERKKCNPDNKCRDCGTSLKDSPHHHYCKDCWKPEYMRLPK